MPIEIHIFWVMTGNVLVWGCTAILPWTFSVSNLFWVVCFCLLGWSNFFRAQTFSPLPSASSHGIHDDGAADSDVHPANGEASQPLWQQPRCPGTKYSHPAVSCYCPSLVFKGCNRGGLKWNEREKSLVDCGASLLSDSPTSHSCRRVFARLWPVAC